VPSRIAFSTLAFPDATLAAAVSAGRRWGYSGVELRSSTASSSTRPCPPNAARRSGGPWPRPGCGRRGGQLDPPHRRGSRVRTCAGSSKLASDWDAPLVRVFGGDLDPPPARKDRLRAAARGPRAGRAAGRPARRGHRRGDARRLLRVLGRGRTAGPGLSGRGARGPGGCVWDKPSSAPDGRDARRGVRQPGFPPACSPRSRTRGAPRAPGTGGWSCSRGRWYRSGRMLGRWTAGGYPHWILGGVGRSAGTPRSRTPRWPSRSTWTC